MQLKSQLDKNFFLQIVYNSQKDTELRICILNRCQATILGMSSNSSELSSYQGDESNLAGFETLG